MPTYDHEQIDAFIEVIFEGRQTVTRDQAIGWAEQGGLPHHAVRLFQGLPPGPFTREELHRVAHEWMLKAAPR